MLESSFKLGRILGIQVAVHYTWFIIFALISFSLSSYFQNTHPDWSPASAWMTATVTALLFFASIVLHELGHSIVALGHGIPVHSITLFIFGGVAQTERDADTARTELLIAIAGPIVSLVLAVLFLGLQLAAEPLHEPTAVALNWLSTINLMVALFNLLPGFPLDGGRVFRALVWGITRDAGRGMRWAVASGKLVAYLMIGGGALIILSTGMLIDGLWLAMIGWFLLTAAEASGRQFLLDHLRRGGTAGEIMDVEVPSVPADRSVQEWVDDFVLAHGRRSFLVKDDHKVLGLVSLSDVHRVERNQWPRAQITEIMTPLAQLHTVKTDTPLPEILKRMEHYAINQLPVTEQGKVTGWITRDRLLRALNVHAELGA
jgi:Zn-dependent protease/predicted transcriptional regulator